MSDLFGNHIVGFPTRRLNFIKYVVYIITDIFMLCSHMHSTHAKPLLYVDTLVCFLDVLFSLIILYPVD